MPQKNVHKMKICGDVYLTTIKKKKTCSALSMLLGTWADAQQMAIIFRGVDAYIWLHQEPAGIIYVPLCVAFAPFVKDHFHVSLLFLCETQRKFGGYSGNI